MRALTFSTFGDPSVLAIRELADPVASPGVAVVRTRAIGLNFADVYRRQGRYHLAGDPPWIAGYEASGEVVGLDPSDRGGSWALGSRVAFADSPFANAELVAVPLDKLLALPDDIDHDVAAAVLLQGLTAQYLVEDSYAVRRGDRVVVHAAAGGVGLLLVQLARARGATVLGVASSPAKQEAARRAGAEHVAGSADWVAAVGAAFPCGADVVYDSIGTTVPDSLACARTGGSVVFYGMAGGTPPPVDPRVLMDRSLRLIGGDLWNVLTTAAERRRRAARLFDEVRSKRLTVAIAQRFPLERGADAHRAIESRDCIGKILFVP